MSSEHRADAAPTEIVLRRNAIAAQLGSHALAEDDSTLNGSHPINANLRDRGVGAVPPVLEILEPHKVARVALPAIRCHLLVPLGWHVIDDGRRTLLFEPRGQGQLNLTLVKREQRDDSALLDGIESEARASYPQPRFTRISRQGNAALGVQNIADGGQALEQHHVLAAGPDVQTVLHARVTSIPARTRDALSLCDLLLMTIDYQTNEGGSSHEEKGWWHLSRRLEAEGRFEEAENAIRDGVDHIGAAASVAQMYAERMVRLKQAGDMAGALNAFKEADGWITFYASMATSGGEGAALSYERDRFRTDLVRMLGFDPRPHATRAPL